MVKLTKHADFERWLAGKTREVAVALAARVALRVAPLLATAFKGATDPTEIRRGVVLPVFRGLAAPWAAATYPLRGTEVAAAADAAGDAAANVAANAADAADAAGAAGAAADAADTAYFAYVDDDDDDSAAVFAADAAANFEGAAIWAAASADATALDEGTAPAELAARKLWPGRRPTWATSHWKRLKASLLEAGDDWEVWTAWYEARLKGGLTNEALEVARVMIAHEIWERGPKVVNAEIKRLIEEHTPKAPSEKIPEVPAQGPGPRYRANEDGLVDRARSTDIDESGNDAGTIGNLLPLAQRCGENLKARLSPNQFPELLATVDHYLAALKPQPGSNIEWGEVWGLGVMLQNAATASERKVDGRLIDALEDSAKAALDSLLTIHGPLILATRDGAKLSEVAAGFKMTREQQEALRDAAERVAKDLKKRKDIITPHAAESVADAVHEMGRGPHPERGSVFALANIKNVSVVLIGGAAVATPTLLGALLGGPVGALVGAPLSLLVVEAVKKSPAFNALVTQLGAKLDTMTDIELRAWLDERARRYARFRSFVIDNQEHLRKIAEATPELKWMLRYIDFIAADTDKK